MVAPQTHLHEGVMGGRVYLNTRSPLFEHSAPPVVRNIICERSRLAENPHGEMPRLS